MRSNSSRKVVKGVLIAVTGFLMVGAVVCPVSPAQAQTTILSETFEGNFPEDNGWLVGDSNVAGTAAYWDDKNSSFGGEGTHGGSWKGYCAGVGHQGTTTSPMYRNSMTAYMSKSINLSGYSSAQLSFWYKIPGIDASDWCNVKIDSTYLWQTSSAVTSWTQRTLDLTRYVGGSHTLTFEFISNTIYSGEGWYLDDILVTGTLPAPPAAPTSVSASDGTYTDKVQVSWTGSSGATGYKAFRNTSNSTTGASQIGTPSASPYNDTTAVAGTTYWYWLKAYNTAGDSGFSNGDSGYRAVTPPAAPTSVLASDGTYTDKVQVSWTASSGATGYKVFRNTSNSSSGASQIGTATASPYNDTTAVAGTTYWYWVKAYNTAGDSGFSNGDSGYRLGTVTLAEAVDNTALAFTTGGSANWFGEATTSYYGGDAAQSGDINDSQESWMQTTVTGPGTVTFYWKVSSEGIYYDYLRFYIDATEQAGSISGTVDWTQKSFIVASGSHTLKWLYNKDGSTSSGSDCGWVDKVEWTPSVSKPDLVIDSVQASKTSLLPNESFSVTVTVKNQGTAAAGFFWVDLFKNLASPPTTEMYGDQRNSIGSLAAGSSKSLYFSGLTYGSTGTYKLWAMADGSLQFQDESNETNNYGPQYGLALTVSAAQQPDMLICKLGDASYIGNNIYNTDGTNQTVSQSTNYSVIYRMRLQNDGTTSSTFVLAGTPGDANWTVQYFADVTTARGSVTRVEGTRQVTTTGWTSPVLTAGSSFDLLALVMTSAPVGSSKTVTVTATSSLDSTRKDTVKAVTTASTLAAAAASVVLKQLATTPNSVSRGQDVEFAYTVKNDTAETAEGLVFRLVCNGKVLGKAKRIPSLAAGEEASGVIRVRIPANTSPGDYFITGEVWATSRSRTEAADKKTVKLTVK